MPSDRTLSQCFAALGIDNPNEMESCANIEEEFVIIKRIYHAKILTVHPDKGGSPDAFRDVRTSWNAIKHVFELKKVRTFVSCFRKSSKKSGKQQKTDSDRNSSSNSTEDEEQCESFSWEDILRSFNPANEPSYDFYATAETEETPAYIIELAKSGRSSCNGTKAHRKCTPDTSSALIPQGSIRIGSFNSDTGSYGRFVHLNCWRVPWKVSLGLRQLGDETTIAVADPSAVLEALQALEGVIISGFLDLTHQDQMQVAQYCMDSGNWAKEMKKKAKKLIVNGDSTEDGAAVGASASSSSTSSAGALANRVNETAVVHAKQRYDPPIPGKNGAMENALSGKTIVMTGVFPELGGGSGLSLGKDKMKKILTSFGARVTSAVSGKTDILMTGTSPGASKVSQARNQGIPLITSHDLKLGLESGKAVDDWVSETPKLIIDKFSAGYAYAAKPEGNRIKMSAEQEAVAKGLVEAPKVIKAPKRAGARAKKARIDYDDDLDENDDDDDFDDDYAQDEYKPSKSTRKRSRRSPREPKSKPKTDGDDDPYVNLSDDEHDVPPQGTAFNIACDICGVDATMESFNIGENDYCPACYDKEGFTNGDLQRFGVSVEPCEETAVVVKAKKPKKVTKAKKARAPKKSTRAKK